MVEVTLKGKLKSASEISEEKKGLFWKEGQMVLKTSQNGKSYYSVPLKIEEKNGEKTEGQFDSIMLIFWEDRLSGQTWQTVANLKENQLITVSGEIGGRDDGLLTVRELEEEVDDEGDVFI
ncbi:MAG: hypothetical protein I3273_03360 [Candidatus Moeniiplasma glomeromycotorum]|nr:hypothetical protein [Candidatus Moeniiplasma glomeromycotorum]MCE8162190.1 hypothetical protein [Candidatus Moeniiplasma glomeromycotorum]MCE8163345.1 hypothetical protein [Candidatus Moeniiplasma glomeromycotorum]MCE8166154.1 hypothetical protein [Candidatus Moeniiplasma glomeromycotorum]MCE8166589.1 hypothetical protein [Candidatus Moeniiplasma glomeromycotorum]